MMSPASKPPVYTLGFGRNSLLGWSGTIQAGSIRNRTCRRVNFKDLQRLLSAA
jgi:hypothetical protein